MIRAYLHSLGEKLAVGDSTEHTHRPALQAVMESFGSQYVVSNEPKRIKVGAPDLIVRKRISKHELLTVGYIETKDIGEDLSKVEKSEQLERYLQLPNLILTNYLEFRWYVKGQKRDTVTPAELSGKKIKLVKGGDDALLELLKSFLEQSVTDINSPKELAARMAGLCKNIDRMIALTFAAGEASELMTDLKQAFERTLLPDITDGQFADMFAQTLGYGLFAARIHHAERGALTPPGSAFTRTGAAREIPKSNPFLRDLFHTIHSPDLENEPFIGFVDDLTAVLAHTDIAAVLAQFGRRTKQEDPILHFYETFLSEYDPKERKRRGVYYTPEPVVSYIVRSVDILLKEKFGLKDGLADTSTIEVEVMENGRTIKKKLPKVLILDPACGTGTFLYAVVDLIRNRFMEQNRGGEWQSFVSQHLIPRIYGFELQMAPYAVAHLKLAMQLAGHDLTEAQKKKWGYDFQKDERLNVYLTNSLQEKRVLDTDEMFVAFRALAEEADAAKNVKSSYPIMVVLGNPPYSGHSANRSEERTWVKEIKSQRKTPAKNFREDTIKERKFVIQKTFIGLLMQDYFLVDGVKLDEKNSKWLQDDYVKFIRFAQWKLAATGHGILGIITNHSYLDNPTFRGMRRNLQQKFDEIYLLDLHGNSKKKEKTPDGGKDENVFDIQQGVSVGLFVKHKDKSHAAIKRADLWGEREGKYAWLGAHDHKDTDWKEIAPDKPFYLFTEMESEDADEYSEGTSIQLVFGTNSVGIVTARDDLVVQWNEKDSFDVAKAFAEMDSEQARREYKLGDDVRDWRVEWAQRDVMESGLQQAFVTPLLYRPFDIRYSYFTGNSRGFMCYPRTDVMRHMLAGENLALQTCRQVAEGVFNHALATRSITDNRSFFSSKGIGYLFPLYLYPEDGSSRKPNLDPKFVAEIGEKLGLKFVGEGAMWTTPLNPPTGSGGTKSKRAMQSAPTEFGPEDVFYYIYAIFHSPTYRERYKEFLKIDFPRVPLTSNLDLFAKLVPLGHELVQYHLLEHSALSDTPIVFPERGSNEVEKVTYDENKQRVFINKEQFFERVPHEVWNFHVGGYQVCNKWLKDRKGRTLSYDDIRHYCETVMALGETIRLMTEIDAAIPGWPIA